jgi:hypothetical protein
MTKQYAYNVECDPDKTHGERFAITQISGSQLTGLGGWFTEAEARTRLHSVGLSDDQIETAIRLAKNKADSQYENYYEETVPCDSEEEENKIKARGETNGYEYIAKVRDRANPGCWRLSFGKPKPNKAA